MGLRILVVDDSPEVTMALAEILKREGYEVAVACDGLEGLRTAYEFQPDLILLDILMPGMSGLETLTHFRDFSNSPVILLTAVSDPEAKVHGLGAGADGYITKPFDVKELKARIAAVLRRASLSRVASGRPLIFDEGRLVIDPGAHQVLVHSQPVSLTPTEYKLLLYLAHNAGRVLSSSQILGYVWGPGYERSPSLIKVCIRRLRLKIETDPDHPRYVLTRRGIGYCLADDL